jgi:NADPH-dependent 2,4-dienoyl-CoA reductase/sulfur reductase-like enzyme
LRERLTSGRSACPTVAGCLPTSWSSGSDPAPATEWLQGSGLELDDGVVCDETLNAGAPGVYAAGDVARRFNPLFGQTMRLEHWTTAAEQGRVAARHAIDPSRAAPCAMVPYFWSDWNDDRIQFVGIPGPDEVQVVAGDPDHRVFLALHRRGERICGALGLNQRQSVIRLRAMIARRARWIEALEFTRAERHRAASTPTVRDSRPLASGAGNGQRAIPLRKVQQMTENGGGGR